MKTLIVEDSRLAREGLVRLLARHPELELVGQAADLQTARALIAAHRPELLFLDIQLPGGSGFELLEQLDEMPRVIFTTAHADQAIRSFDFDTVDYLLKPIEAERLALAVQRALRRDGAVAPSAEAPLQAESRIFIKDGERCHLLRVDEIRCIESCKNHVRLSWGTQRAALKRPLQAVEARLPPGLFFRASRQWLISLRAVARIEESLTEGYLVTLDDGQRIEVSRRQAQAFKAALSL